MLFNPSPEEVDRRNTVMSRILDDIRTGTTIYLPDFDPNVSDGNEEFALIGVGLEPNIYGGTLDEFRYQFEGEEDLLHLMITRQDMGEISPEEAQAVVDFLYPGVPPAMMWFKPGKKSQHFYIGHDVLLEYLS